MPDPPTAGEPPVEPAPLPWRVRPARDTRGFLSPVVARLARERGVDAAALMGTGRGGRVTRRDVLAAAAGEVAGTAEPRGDEIVPFNRVQVRAGAALLASKRTSAHALCVTAVDYSAVVATRDAAGEQWREQEGFSLTYLPFVARAVVDALGEFPHVNASVEGDALVVHGSVGLGIAVDLDHHGLVVPVIHGAESLSLRGIARAVRDLATRARAKRLVPDDVGGGTFTITNPGGYGTWISVPIINQPEVAILSTDGVSKQVVADGDRLAIRSVGHLCLSFDHRAFDGAYAGAFLGRVREIVEARDWSAEL